MVRGRLEIPLEKSGARGFQKNGARCFQKNGARGLQTKWGQRFAEKMKPGWRPILLTFHLSCVHIILVQLRLLSGHFWEIVAHSVDHMFYVYFDYL